MWFEPILLIGADVAASEDPIEDESLFDHTVLEGGDPWSTSTKEAAHMWGIEFQGGAIFTSGQMGEEADWAYFYAEDNVFRFDAQDFTLEFWLLTWNGGENAILPLVTNQLPFGSAGSWGLSFTDSDDPMSTLRLRAGSTSVDADNVWDGGSWRHVALVRTGDRGIVYLDGIPVIDDPNIFQGITFSLAGDRRLSFAGWSYGGIPNWHTMCCYWDEIRISRGARYTEPFTPIWSSFPRLD